MDLISQVGLWLFVIYIPILIILLSFIAPKKHPHFDWRFYWISNLGYRRLPSHPYYFWSFNLFALLGLFYLLNLKPLLSLFPAGQLYLFFSLLDFVLISLITFFPMDTKGQTHFSLFGFLFSVLSLVNIFQIPVILYLFPGFYLPVIMTVFTLIINGFLATGVILIRHRYPHTDSRDLHNLPVSEKSWVIKNITLFEWLIFYCQLLTVWLISLALL